MAALPTVVVTNILGMYPDPADPTNKTVLEWTYKLVNMGASVMEEQGYLSFANTDNKAQVKTAVDNVMIASATAKGYSLNANHIWTVADIAG